MKRPKLAQSPPGWRDLNAFISRLPKLHGRGESAGAVNEVLAGWTVAVKDNIEVAGIACTCGTPSLKSYVPRVDAPAVQRLREAGGVIVGKTNMHELAYGITSNNIAFGPVRNAHDPDYFAGGSSGGTAVSIAIGAARAGLGTDTGGSSRIPAALNGIVGFRPTPGRYPRGGVALISPTRDVIGPMARNVADVDCLDAVLAGTREATSQVGRSRHLRIGLPTEHFQENLHPDVRRVLANVVALLRDAGVQVIPADVPGITGLNSAVSFPVVLYETPAALREFLAAAGLQLSLEKLHDSIASPDVKALVGMAMRGQVSREAYELALRTHRPRLQQAYRDYFATHRLDAILFPTTPLPASLIATSDTSVLLNGEPVPTFATYIQNTDPASNAGIPGLSVPAGFSEHGLPIGVELDGPEGSDRHLLAVGAAVEAILNTNKSNSVG